MIRKPLAVLAALAIPMIAHADHVPGHTKFMVRIENVSTPQSLALSNGQTAPAPNSPGLWAVVTTKSPAFVAGKLDRGQGLETQAEDGNPGPLSRSLAKVKGVKAVGVYDTPVGDDKAGPALPGKAYEFTFDAVPGDRLLLTTMFGQSNDWFYAPAEAIALFDDGRPLAGDITAKLELWDAGTEVNEEPGLGPNQGPRQAKPNTGTSEKKPVSRAKGYTVPPVTGILRVTITPTGMASK